MSTPIALPPSPVIPISQLTTRPVSWLWPQRLALGKLAILDGDPGLGKSFMMLDLCARLSTGRAFPDGSPGLGPANSLFLNGEDGDEDTSRPRLEALGADLERVFVVNRNDQSDLLRLPGQTAQLDDWLKRSQALLVVIDPITAFLDAKVLTNMDLNVRRALLPLARLAEKYGCVVQLVRHLNKSGGKRALYRGGGSIGFLAACRSGWLVAPDPENGERRVLAQVKNNLAPRQPSLVYQTTQTQPGMPATLSWLGTSALSADDLLARASRSSPVVQLRDRAREFLLTVLDQEPRTARDIWKLAREQGLSERTLKRAKRELDIRSVRVCREQAITSYWLLPGQELPPSVAAHVAGSNLEPWLAPLRARFPPSTPLDDL